VGIGGSRFLRSSGCRILFLGLRADKSCSAKGRFDPDMATERAGRGALGVQGGGLTHLSGSSAARE